VRNTKLFGTERCGLFVTIVEALEQFAHAAIVIVEIKLLINPADYFEGVADVGIQLGGKLLLLRIGHPPMAADKKVVSASSPHSQRL
jgi:hypothetical protein